MTDNRIVGQDRRPALIRKFVGNRRFYRHLMTIAVPIMIQNVISNFVNMLDNIMVGQVGTEQMSGVAIVNQLIFVYYLCMFGGLSGVGIFTAQYYGQRDDEGVRHTFRFKLWLSAVITAVVFVVLLFFGKEIIGAFLNGDSSAGDTEAALRYGLDYLSVIFFSMPAIMLIQVYAMTLRDCSRTKLPMIASIVSVLTNLVLDYLLIFGKFGFPEMGVKGAALATVIARFVEMSIIVIYSHSKRNEITWLKGMYRTLLVPWKYVKEFLKKGIPILINEGLWSMGMSFLLQCYSMRGMEVVAAFNIANVIGNLLNQLFFAMGDSVAIIVGQLLGAGKMEEAKDTDNKILAFSCTSGVIVGCLLAVASFFFPNLYNTTSEVRDLATHIILVNSIFTPQWALLHSTYFTVRAGGRTIITFFFDSGFMMVASIPAALILSRFTALPALLIYVIVNLLEIIKLVIGLVMVCKNIWIRKITV